MGLFLSEKVGSPEWLDGFQLIADVECDSDSSNSKSLTSGSSKFHVSDYKYYMTVLEIYNDDLTNIVGIDIVPTKLLLPIKTDIMIDMVRCPPGNASLLLTGRMEWYVLNGVNGYSHHISVSGTWTGMKIKFSLYGSN